MTEILLILAVALIVIGPRKLPDLARTLGRGLAEFRRATDDLQRTIYQESRKPLDAKEFLKDVQTARTQTRPGPPPGDEPQGPTQPPPGGEPTPKA